MSQSDISSNELIQQAADAFTDANRVKLCEDYLKMFESDPVLAACEAFYMNGSYDDQTGDVDGLGHIYRVSRWTVETDSQGFRDLTEHGSTAEAEKYMEARKAEEVE